MEFFRNPSINFVGAMKPAFTVSMILILVSAVSLVIHGGPRQSIDFTGGTDIQVRFEPVPDIAQIRDVLAAAGIGTRAEGLRRLIQAAGGVFVPDARLAAELLESPVGGAGYETHGKPLPDETLALARECDALLLGAVGGPQWESLERPLRPEQGLLGLRAGLELFSNLRPAICFPALADASSLKRDVVAGLDIMIVRELTSGVYFGEPRGIIKEGNERVGINTQRYTESEIARVARSAPTGRLCFELLVEQREIALEVHLVAAQEVGQRDAADAGDGRSRLAERGLREPAAAGGRVRDGPGEVGEVDHREVGRQEVDGQADSVDTHQARHDHRLNRVGGSSHGRRCRARHSHDLCVRRGRGRERNLPCARRGSCASPPAPL